MDLERRRLGWGRSEGRARRWLTFVGGYAVVVAVGTAYRLLSPPAFVAPVLYEDPLITALLLGPFVVAAVGAAGGGGFALGLAVGAAATLVYGAVLLGAALLSTGGAAGLGELVSFVVASAVVAGGAGVLGAAVGLAVRR